MIAYYSVTIFLQSGYNHVEALAFSLGTGILNWIFALPAFFTIDTFGRRFLLLFTFPFLCITLLWTGMSFFIKDKQTRTAMITTGMYLYEVFYSPGMGPVPFSYSAESYPMQVLFTGIRATGILLTMHQVRDVGMASATAVLWAFNFILSFTWPALVKAFQPQGAFGWYAAWCGILWLCSKYDDISAYMISNGFVALLFFPETKELTLEELDAVFSVSTHRQVARGFKEPFYWVNKYILRRDVQLPPLVDIGQLRGEVKEEHLVGAA